MLHQSSNIIVILIVVSACVTSTTLGYDGSMMNGLNILPSYSEYFALNTATLALNTSAIWIGGALSSFIFGPLADRLGRIKTLYIAAVLTVIAAIIQAASQNIAMFICARILIGLGTGGSGIVAPIYVAETLPLRWRAWGLGILTDFYYVGGLVSAGITYGTGKIESTWAWRIPSAFQGVFSIICLLILPFVPESPRWLAYHDRGDEALRVLALTMADGDINNESVRTQHKEIMDALTWEKNNKAMSVRQMVSTPSNRKRIFLVFQVACCVILSGNNIVSYYLGTILTQAGLTDATVQLKINIVLNAWCLVVSVFGTWIADRVGRKPLALSSTALMVIFLFLVGAFTKIYGTSDDRSGAYATTAMIFLFQGSYSLGWTPLNLLYPPEVLPYSMRANGLSLFAFSWNGLGLFTTLVFPFALEAIGWQTYMINASWDVLELVTIYYTWVETKGKTLEQLDGLFDGQAIYLEGAEKEADGDMNNDKVSEKRIEADGGKVILIASDSQVVRAA